MYLAQGLTRKKQHLDEDEFLDVVTMPFQQLVEQVMDGTITDAKTVATTLKVKVLLGLCETGGICEKEKEGILWAKPS